TLISCVVLFILAFQSGMARGAGKIKMAQSLSTKNEAYIIANRIHMNTLESMVIFLPLLWIATVYTSEMIASIFGGIWVLSRIAYAILCKQDPQKRTPAFMLSILMLACLLITGLYGIVF
ncbi:MAPEG family protein, partial [Candidatus Gracilibacteria bacterium]|nr:MAPEG family protein [Candidatus Gracilibacteria bacterium]